MKYKTETQALKKDNELAAEEAKQSMLAMELDYKTQLLQLKKANEELKS